MTDVIQKALDEVRSQIARKTQQRDQLNVEIVQLKATEIGLQNSLGQQIQAPMPWTELVRAVLNNYPAKTMSAAEVRDVLQSWGYTFTGFKNPMALIHTCLQRLAESGEISRSATRSPFKWELYT